MNRYLVHDLADQRMAQTHTYILNIAGYTIDGCLDTLTYTFTFPYKPTDPGLAVAQYMLDHPHKFENIEDYFDTVNLPYWFSLSVDDLADQLDMEIEEDDIIKRLRVELFKVNKSNSFTIN